MTNDDDLLRIRVTAFARLGLGQWKPAEKAFAAALELLDDVPVDVDKDRPSQRPQLLLGRSEALLQLGELAQAECCLREAVPGLGEPLAGAGKGELLEPQALSLLAMRQLMVGRPGDAVPLLRMALDRLPGNQPMGSRHSELRARIVERMAIAISAMGDIEAALRLHAEALTVFEHPLHVDLARDRAVALVNCGIGEWTLGRYSQAVHLLRRGLAVFGGLFDAGSERHRADVALAQMNLGNALTDSRDHEGGIAAYQEAARNYDAAIARAARGAGAGRLRASRALTEMNLGWALSTAGRFDDAARCFRSARRRYADLRVSQPRLREFEARAWVNQAHLLARQGRHAAARHLYARGWNSLLVFVDAGQTHLAPEMVNARLGLARMLAAQGRGDAAALHLEAALSTLVELTNRGQVQHARRWLAGVTEHAAILIDGAAVVKRPSDAVGARALIRAMARAPRYGDTGLAARADVLNTALDELQRWTIVMANGAQATGWYPGVATALVLHLLDVTARLLGDSDPDELRRHHATTMALVARLYRAARALPQADHLLADWFLRTRGLRAQRSALAAGRDLELVELREQLAQLRRLEEEMLAARDGGAGVPGPAPSRREAQAARWRELHAQCDQRRTSLVSSGQLPAAPALDARTLAKGMSSSSALLMLARGNPDELLAIALHRPSADGVCMTSRVLRFDAAEAQLDFGAVNRALRRALKPPGMALRRVLTDELLEPLSEVAVQTAADTDADAAADADADADADAEQAALAAHRWIADRLLQPMLLQLAAQGMKEIDIVPSADLHLLPFHEALAATLERTGGTLAVYPSCGAWAQRPSLSQPIDEHLPAWAVVGHAALDGRSPLHWAALEQWLTGALWTEAGASVAVLAADGLHAEGVTALIGMGHGTAPADNPARSGLLVGGGAVMSAHDLPRIRSCHRVLLSCCVLGRVDEVHTEAMGFLASSFGYGTRFGAGWLVEVPDAEACLFSIALQYALRQAHLAHHDEPVRWNEVFHRLRQDIGHGRWPPGFGVWLMECIPTAIDAAALPGGPWFNRYEYLRDFDGGMFEHPPPSLCRLMPWAVTLGR